MNAGQHILVFAIRFYRWVLSPVKTVWFGPLGRCRYTPSCSAYALEAVQCHGAVRGGWLAVCRVGRCHPWGGCGHDPVPAERSEISDLRFHTARRGNAVGKTVPVRQTFGIIRGGEDSDVGAGTRPSWPQRVASNCAPESFQATRQNVSAAARMAALRFRWRRAAVSHAFNRNKP